MCFMMDTSFLLNGKLEAFHVEMDWLKHGIEIITRRGLVSRIPLHVFLLLLIHTLHIIMAIVKRYLNCH